jgi:hypothetical protein
MYFEIPTTAKEAERFVLHEGAALRAFDATTLLHHERVTPHDAFALWLHASRERVAVRG